MNYIGIDIAKRKHVATALTADRHILFDGTSFANSRDGFDSFTQQLNQLDGDIMIGLEATGHYWLALYCHLCELDYSVVVLNPLQVHAYQRTDLRRRKNDRIDAFWIADFIRINAPDLTPHIDHTTTLQLRELSRFRLALVQQIGDCKRRIITVLDRIFPEYETLFSGVFRKTSRRLLDEAVTPDQFAAFDLHELTDKLRRYSRGHMGQDKAEALQAAAQQSVGIGYLTDVLQTQIRCLLVQLDTFEQQVAHIDQELEKMMASLPQHITSIPGISTTTGSAILGEIGDVTRFETSTKLVAYAGIDPVVYQSGEFEAKRSRMSKRGSPYLRRALWNAALPAVQNDPQLKAYYDKKRAEGKSHRGALGAICRKLLIRIYVVLAENRPYEVRK